MQADGCWVEGEEPLGQHVYLYYSDLFTSNAGFNTGSIIRNVQAIPLGWAKQYLLMQCRAST